MSSDMDKIADFEGWLVTCRVRMAEARDRARVLFGNGEEPGENIQQAVAMVCEQSTELLGLTLSLGGARLRGIDTVPIEEKISQLRLETDKCIDRLCVLLSDTSQLS